MRKNLQNYAQHFKNYALNYAQITYETLF